MRHLDDDTLALVALGEHEEPEHLAACAACGTKLGELRRVVAAARHDPPSAPAPHVWEGVRAELGLSPDLVPGAPAGPSDPFGSPDSSRSLGDFPGVPAASLRRSTRGRTVRHADAPVRRTRLWALAAALTAGLLAGAGGTLLLQRLPSERTPHVVAAHTDLGPLPGNRGTGVAEIRTGRDGGKRLQVRLDDLPAFDGFYEVWLLDRGAKRMISLGTVDPSGRGSYPLPEGVTTAGYPVVDISREPLDGDPRHSSDSVLRGTLPGG